MKSFALRLVLKVRVSETWKRHSREAVIRPSLGLSALALRESARTLPRFAPEISHAHLSIRTLPLDKMAGSFDSRLTSSAFLSVGT